MRRTLSAPAGVTTTACSDTATSYSYPQIPGYHDPARLNHRPLVVMNPDAGSEAAMVRDEAVRKPLMRNDSHKREEDESDERETDMLGDRQHTE